MSNRKSPWFTSNEADIFKQKNRTATLGLDFSTTTIKVSSIFKFLVYVPIYNFIVYYHFKQRNWTIYFVRIIIFEAKVAMIEINQIWVIQSSQK